MTFKHLDWSRILSEHRVEYVSEGANVKRGNVNVRCPFCGTDDPSYHMGIDPDTSNWACWRNPAHRGKNPARLLIKLLNIAPRRVFDMLGQVEEVFDDSDWSSVPQRLSKPVRRATDRTLALPKEIKKIYRSDLDLIGPFVQYLEVRGFDDPIGACRRYDIHYCTKGEFVDRIVLPIYYQARLVAWTSRTIGSSPLRYRDSSVEESLIPPKETLFNFDEASRGGRALVVVEGPLDVMKIDYYGRDFGVTAVGLYTASVSQAQQYLLPELYSKFASVFCMMDATNNLDRVDSYRMSSALSITRHVVPLPPPYGFKDAGDLPPAAASRLARHLALESIKRH